MSVSSRKLAANQANAQKSLGPVTVEGKAKVSQNRRSHGLAGTFRVQPTENQEMYENLLDDFIEAEQPDGEVELQLVRKMSEHTWCAARAVRLQEGCIVNTQTPEQIAAKVCATKINWDIERFARYQAMHDRAYQRASAELMKRRQQRLLAARGFESQKRAEAKEERATEMHEVRHATAVARLDKLENKTPGHNPKPDREEGVVFPSTREPQAVASAPAAAAHSQIAA